MVRKLATFAGVFCLAVFLAQYALPIKLLPYAAIACAFLSLAAIFARGDFKLRILLVCAGLVFGLGWSYLYNLLFYQPAVALDGQTVYISATVTDYPQVTAYGSKVQVKLEPENGGSIKALLYTGCEGLLPGDRLELNARLKLAGSFDGEETTYYTSKGIFLIAYEKELLSVTYQEKIPLQYFPARLAKALKEKIQTIFSPDISPLMTALLTGDRTLISDSFSNQLSRSGLSHTVAVSGMHVSFLLGIVMLLTGRRRKTAMIGIPVILVFMAMTGNTPSVVRAGLMQIALLVAPTLKRESDTPTTLAAVLMLLLISNPFSAAHIGLQLSFGSIAGIYLFSNPLYQWIKNHSFYEKLSKRLPFTNKKEKPVLNFIGASVSSTLGAMVFTVPLTAYYFGTITIMAPISNLLVLWSVSFSFSAGMISCILGFIWAPLGTLAGFVVWPVAKYLITVTQAIGNLPFAAISAGQWAIKAWLLYIYVMLFAFLLIKGKKRRPLVPVCCGCVSLMLVLILVTWQADSAEFTFTVLDVGQGQCLVITSGDKTAIIDCGGNRFQNAGDIAGDYLASINRYSVDLLILTHYHEDHAGGALQLFSRVKVECLIVPDIEDEGLMKNTIFETAKSSGCEIIEISREAQITIGRAAMTIYEPVGKVGSNEQCISVLCNLGPLSALITGDMDSGMEHRLLVKKQLPDIDVLVAGHHGSKYSSSQELIDAVEPEIAVISVGKNNYGHPSEDTIARLELFGAVIYRTDLYGTITIRG